MKKIILTVLTIITVLGVNAQGSDLIFSRVIDTVLIVEATTCTDLYANPVISPSITVPSGFVWKITSISMERGNVNAERRLSAYDCTNGNFSAALCGNLRKHLVGTTFNIYGDNLFSQGEFPMWFNSGTVFDAVMSSKSDWYKWTRNQNQPFRVAIALSIIEFIQSPID